MTRVPLFLAVLSLCACEPKTLQFTAGAVESLPQQAVPADGLTSGQSIAGEIQLKKFFRQECHMQPAANYCPKRFDVVRGGENNEFKFTATTLLGLIFHAELYGGGLRTACAGQEVTLSPASFLSETAGGEPNRYLLDGLARYTCLETEVHDGLDRFFAYSVKKDSQSTLVVRFKEPSPGNGPLQTDLFQVDVLLDADQQPTFLAFNWAGVSSMAARAVVLVNLRTHRFAVKYLTGPAGQENFVSALGVGGVNRTTGAAHQGFYRARYTDEKRAPKQACIDNATQLLEIDDTECIAAGVPIDWTSSAAVASWLALDADGQTRFAPWLAKFEGPGSLAAPETPSDQADADRFFPRSVK